LSASERERYDENGQKIKEGWTNQNLASLNSKIQLRESSATLRYYLHGKLSPDRFIPNLDTAVNRNSYSDNNLVSLEQDLLRVTEKSSLGFDDQIRLLLYYLEKYLWCVPAYTGNDRTDISLFNHSKDTTAIAHAIYKSFPVDYLESLDQEKNIQWEKYTGHKLSLIVGDIPGIQNYLFDISNKKASKMLRGRSIFIQVLTKILANKFLSSLGLTPCNLIMFSGGKFYILAQSGEQADVVFNNTRQDIEKALFNTYNGDIKFNCGKTEFKWKDLYHDHINFGDIIKAANDRLATNRSGINKHVFIGEGSFVLHKTIPHVEDSDSNKCQLTDKPLFGESKIYKEFGGGVLVSAYNEYNIGKLALKSDKKSNGICSIVLSNDLINIKEVSDNPVHESQFKILVNPDIEDLVDNDHALLKGFDFVNICNSAPLVAEHDLNGQESESEEGDTIPGTLANFNTISNRGKGAKYLCLIKGDIDNLGLIMALGLAKDSVNIDTATNKNDLTGISRSTILSSHYSYFFSEYMNHFLSGYPDVYVVFSGGDDLMLICPQSQAVDLVKSLNGEFGKFVCSNPEIHISWSITPFKPSTPIRIVAELAEQNQKKQRAKAV
jgi:CRISPR-associated protein Csm1